MQKLYPSKNKNIAFGFFYIIETNRPQPPIEILEE
jgi:hypothetical protein